MERLGRRVVMTGVGGLAKLWCCYLNKTTVVNGGALVRAVTERPKGLGLVTVSNHMSTVDDPLMWGAFPMSSSRWVLAAEDICFTNAAYSAFFRAGKCIPITRGGGVYQPHMEEALSKLAAGEWLHTFPEGKVSQDEHSPIRRLKWGTASLIVRSPRLPLLLPLIHHGFHFVMPEKFMLGRRRPPLPLCNKTIRILVGDPIELDLPAMKDSAILVSRHFSLPLLGWPCTADGLDEPAQRCLYSAISDKIRASMDHLRRTLDGCN